MPIGPTAIILGVILFVGGVIFAGSGREAPQVANTAISMFGSVRQTISGNIRAIRGQRVRTSRDWIGWGLSALGIALSIYGLMRA